jgi:hypothetical protein
MISLKNIFRFSGLIILFLSILLFHSCKLEKVPILTTLAVDNILGTTAMCGGIITDEGSGTVLMKGVCWSISNTPTIADDTTSDGAGAGSFTSRLSGLNGATVYYVRAYATNSAGTGYGKAISFTTLGQVPDVSTDAATNVTPTSATLNGSVNANLLSTIVTFEYGTSASYGNSVTAAQNPVNDRVNVSVDVTGLSRFTTYYVRTYATNSLGTAYGNEISFKTPLVLIGESYQGGIVAYILKPGDPGYIAGETHGLIAAPSDQSTAAPWGCPGTTISGADGRAMGTGAQNTIDIVAGCTTAGIAAKLCFDLELGGYSDWYLPSADEFCCFYHNLSAIGGFFWGQIYWTSTESGARSAYYTEYIYYMCSQNVSDKSSLHNVRAVRSF